MKITMSPTALLTRLNGQQVRLWDGITDQGHPCKVYVAAIAATEDIDLSAACPMLGEIPTPDEALVPAWMLTPGRNQGEPK